MIGKLDDNILEALFETIPMEFSVLDKNDKVIAWNKHNTRVFKRPEAIIGRDVRNCHPKKSLHKVETILSEMKGGQRNIAEFWISMVVENNPEKILIQYYALRDKDGKYLGCLEASQKINHIQSLKGEKRLLD